MPADTVVSDTVLMASLLSGNYQDGGEEQESLEIIETVLRSRGWSSAMIMAAMVNAIFESGLQQSIVGDDGLSVGLFQLHANGAGAGFSVEERSDPYLNTHVIANEAARAPDFVRVVSSGTTDLAVLASVFCSAVERPLYSDHDSAQRASFARDLDRIHSIEHNPPGAGYPSWLQIVNPRPDGRIILMDDPGEEREDGDSEDGNPEDGGEVTPPTRKRTGSGGPPDPDPVGGGRPDRDIKRDPGSGGDEEDGRDDRGIDGPGSVTLHPDDGRELKSGRERVWFRERLRRFFGC